MKPRLVTVQARGFAASRRTFRIRPLDQDEIQQLLLLARETGWWSNPRLIDLVLVAGLDGNAAARKRVGSDWFLGLNLAREIWIVTLREIARHARAIGKLARTARRVPFIRRYRFRDLITPGMLLLIVDRAAKIDLDRFAKHVVETTVADITVKGRSVHGVRRRKLIKKTFDWLVPTILEAWGIEKELLETLPHEVLPTLPHRFFAAWCLAATLDWQQYHRLLDYYHASVEDLLFRSRQLGGADTIRAETHLATGKPAFPDVIMPVRHLPPEVCAQLFVEAYENRLVGFVSSDRSLLHTATRQAFRRMLDTVPGEWSLASEAIRRDAAADGFVWFLNEISKHPRIVERACYVYFEQFRRASARMNRERYDEMIAKAKGNMVPDVRIVVEGPSDAIYLKAICHILLAERDILIAVEPRNGKADVAKRVRDLIRADLTAAVVAVLDADANDEERELLRLSAEYLRLHRYASGAIEDQFEGAAHLDTLNAQYPGRDEFTEADLARPFERSIRKALHSKRKAPFDKVKYAGQLAERIRGADQIPERLRLVVESAIDLAEQRRRRFPSPDSVISIDRRTRSVLLDLIDRSDLVSGDSDRSASE